MKHPNCCDERNRWFRVVLATVGVSFCVQARAADPAPIRAGMIGLDTSHVPAFAKLFNNPKATGDIAGVHIVAGYPGGTDIPASRDRVKGFTEQLRGMGVEIVGSIPELLGKVDVVLLESVDGRIHLQEARPPQEGRRAAAAIMPATTARKQGRSATLIQERWMFHASTNSC